MVPRFLSISLIFLISNLSLAASAPENSKDPSEMVAVPAGWFAFQKNYKSFVYLDYFKIDKYEITNDFYCQFLNDADPCSIHYNSQMQIARLGSLPKYKYAVKTGKERFPVCFVNMGDAEAFAAWRGKVYGGTYSLPNEQQWEKAAGWDPELKKMFTYGYHADVIDHTWCNYDNYLGPLPVGSFNGTNGRKDAKNYYGCYDMSGNVWEWTTSPYDMTSRVIRGGGFYSKTVRASDFEKWLNKGPRNVSVCKGFNEEGADVYVGITNDITRRQSQWRGTYNIYGIDGASGFTRNQARTIEQVLIEQNPNYFNIRNSINPRSPYYEQAIDWGKNWLNNQK